MVFMIILKPETKPEGKSELLAVRVQSDLLTRLITVADKDKVTVAVAVRQILANYCDARLKGKS
jgi:hypothetical protein